MELLPSLARWIHLLAGVMWLGLLFYFNFVQAPAIAAAQADGSAAGISRHIVPRALLYFRWSAVVTWLAGAALLGGHFADAFLLRPGHAAIGVGAWLGTIMLFNVWVLIWPNQKKLLGLVEASELEKARARKTTLTVSRLNLALSIPMLFFMAAGAHTQVYFGM